MRLNLVPPAKLSPEQKPLYDDMRRGIESNFKGFIAIDRDQTLIGPWNPWLRFARYGGPVWELVKAVSTSPKLPRPVREIAILVTGAHFRSAYEIYAMSSSPSCADFPTTRSRPSPRASVRAT